METAQLCMIYQVYLKHFMVYLLVFPVKLILKEKFYYLKTHDYDKISYWISKTLTHFTCLQIAKYYSNAALICEAFAIIMKSDRFSHSTLMINLKCQP